MKGVSKNLLNVLTKNGIKTEYVWKLVEKHGMVDTDSVQDNMKRAIKNELIELHNKSFEGTCQPQTISKPNPNSKRPMWSTYVLDPSAPNGKARIQAKTEDAFFLKLAEVYLENYREDKSPNLLSFWDEYYEYRTHCNIKASTLDKDVQMYNKYIKTVDLFQKPVDKISRRDLQRWYDKTLETIGLRKQEASNVNAILRGLFELAIDHNYIKENPMEVKTKKRLKAQKNNTDPSRLFSEEEYFLLNSYFWKAYKEEKSSYLLAVLFNMQLGLRSGELVALKWSDVIKENGRNILFVHRKEERNYAKVTQDGAKTSGYRITDHCKWGSDRKLKLNKDQLHILELLRELGYDNNGFIFGNGERMTSRQLAYQYEKACKNLGILVRRNHTMRRTVASILYVHKVSPTYIQHLLGHKTLQMTLEYIGQVLPEEEDVDKALAVFNSNHQESPNNMAA